VPKPLSRPHSARLSLHYDAAQAVVDAVHRRLDFRHPPFRFEDFLSAYESYKVFEVDLPRGLDGRVLLTPDGEQKTIHLRKDNPRPRIRFTLAHEIIHAELHFPRGQLQELVACRTAEHPRDGRRTPMEREADFGAAALLMPLWMLDEYLPYRLRHGYPDKVVRDMARLFRVSETAMRIQLKNYKAHTGDFRRPS
jgi:Zn-dependent peptidase ImmA (M78 family)